MTELRASQEGYWQTRSRVEGIVAATVLRCEQARAVRQDLEQRVVTAQSPRGDVRVAIAGNGVLRDVQLGEKTNHWQRSELAAEIMACVRRAYAKLPELAEQVYADQLDADDAAARRTVMLLREAFDGKENER